MKLFDNARNILRVFYMLYIAFSVLFSWMSLYWLACLVRAVFTCATVSG